MMKKRIRSFNNLRLRTRLRRLLLSKHFEMSNEDLQQAAGGGQEKGVKFRSEITHPKAEFGDGDNFRRKTSRFSFRRFSRKPRRSRDEDGLADVVDERKSKLQRQDSVIIKKKPGESFSPYADIFVTPLHKCDPKLGTLGELRHQIQTGSKTQIKKFLRHNDWTMQHRIRAELWKELCKRDGSLDAHVTVYKETAARLSEPGSVSTPMFMSTPGMVKSNHLLKDSGRRVVGRILTTLEHLRPDFTKIPILYPLAAALLHYMEEDEVYACLVKMVEQNQKYLLQTDIAYAASKRTILMLMKKHLGRVYTMLKKAIPGDDDSGLLSIFHEWHAWIFRDLPFPHLVRVIDCFMFEGQKVLYRVALAIMYLWRKETHKSLKDRIGVSGELLSTEISEFCKALPSSPEHLLKAAFGIRNLSMTQIRNLQERFELQERMRDPSLGSGVAELNWKKQSVVVPKLADVTMETKILNAEQVSIFLSWLPARIQLLCPFLLFSVRVDGTSFTRLWQKIDEAERTLFVILTANDEIIGAYCSSEWAPRRSGKPGFFGTGESFLFRFTPFPERFEWIGIHNTVVAHSQELFFTATANSLTIGGGGSGQGLSIREALVGGDTSRCETFDNKPLVEGGTFDIKDMEVFTFATEIEE